ncbi:hypothetical protein F4804DRAFT_240083 [Jackrogersella minutella]|nr:hypothetical protein F4804DRAFT_240083 [Jackrogersella minutella]
MVSWDQYTGPPFLLPSGDELRDSRDRLVVPMEPVRQEFTLHNHSCYREQSPLVVSYAITVHKSQGVTLERLVCDISDPEFASGLSYVTVSRVSTLRGLLFEAPFNRARVFRQVPGRAMQMKIADFEGRKLRALDKPLYDICVDDDDDGIDDDSVV